ncbi:MAG: carbon monoxide dehydrogenase subunit G [Pseudomonadota bacterium]
MEMSGERQIAAPRAAVWEALNDPTVLKECIPGCQEMERDGDGFSAVVKQKVGPVSATFKGAVTLSNVAEGESYTISGEGKGGAAGFAKGSADVSLADGADGTLLTYEVEAKVGGKIAQLGGRLIDGFAKKMADQFFDRFQEMVGGPAPEETPAEAGDENAVEGKEKKSWLSRVTG